MPLLHHEFGLKVFEVSKDRGDGGYTSLLLEAKKAILAHDVAVNCNLVPRFRMTDIIDRNVVVLAPEKWDGGERRAVTKRIESHRLPLSFGDDPVLNPDALPGSPGGHPPLCPRRTAQCIRRTGRGERASEFTLPTCGRIRGFRCDVGRARSVSYQ